MKEKDIELFTEKSAQLADEIAKEAYAEYDLKKYEYEKYGRIERGGSSRVPHKKHATNYTPPKKRRKK